MADQSATLEILIERAKAIHSLDQLKAAFQKAMQDLERASSGVDLLPDEQIEELKKKAQEAAAAFNKAFKASQKDIRDAAQAVGILAQELQKTASVDLPDEQLKSLRDEAKSAGSDLESAFRAADAAISSAGRTIEKADKSQLRSLKSTAREVRSDLGGTFRDAEAEIRRADAAIRQFDKDIAAASKASSALDSIAGTFRNIAGIIIGSQIVREMRDFATATVEAQIAVQNIRNALLGATGDAGSAASEFKFLVETSRELGTSLEGSGGAFARLTAAARGTKLEGEATRDIFRAVSETATTLGLNADQTKDSVRALEQMISKNVISAEELRLQLGDHIPGAMALMAKAAGVTVAELAEMLKNGEVLAEDVLPRFAEELRHAFGPGTESAMSSLRAGLERMRTELLLIRAEFADGFAEEVSKNAADAAVSLQNLNDAARQGGEVAGVYADAYGGLANSILRVAGQSDESVPPLDRLLSLLKDQTPVGRATAAFNQLAEDLDRIKAAMGLSGDATTELGAKSRDLSETTEQLAEHRRKLAAEEREVAAAMRESDAELQRQIAAGNELVATWNAEWEAASKVDEALRGNSQALAEQSDLLAERVRLMEESGGVNSAVTERIREETAALAELAAKYGNELPESLKALMAKYPELAEAQEKSRRSAKDTADQQRDLAAANREVADSAAAAAAAQVGPNASKLQDEAASLQETVDALKKKQEAGALTAEELTKLFEAEDALSNVNLDLSRALLDTAVAVEDVGAAVPPTTQQLDALATFMEAAGHNFDSGSTSLAEFAVETKKAREEMKPGIEVMDNTSDAAERMAQEWTAAAKAQGELAPQTTATAKAIEGLRQRQHEYVATAEDASAATSALGDAATATAEQVGKAGETLGGSFDGAVTTAEKLEGIYARIHQEHLPEIIRLTRELAEVAG